ncbi:PHD and RING finger domain-containing protein 1-like [Protopterus annectens]|uniref:PHD and RING finger domain-containing protein 1-like n=1 Tax=Protopterus annectens TaxID=7888 RepID=UPI001CFBBF67|nr:PHD and RING finger domain-containing protein 1-like [Protopterus annectens]
MDEEDSQDEQMKRSAAMGKRKTTSVFIDGDSGEDSETSEESGSECEDGNDEDNESVCEEEEEEDDLDEEFEGEVGEEEPAILASSNNAETGSDEEGENCPICLNLFKGQLIGTPENCAHFFCIDCILEWSKVNYFNYRYSFHRWLRIVDKSLCSICPVLGCTLFMDAFLVF